MSELWKISTFLATYDILCNTRFVAFSKFPSFSMISKEIYKNICYRFSILKFLRLELKLFYDPILFQISLSSFRQIFVWLALLPNMAWKTDICYIPKYAIIKNSLLNILQCHWIKCSLKSHIAWYVFSLKTNTYDSRPLSEILCTLFSLFSQILW